MARGRRDKVHIDDNFDMVDVAMAMRRLASVVDVWFKCVTY